MPKKTTRRRACAGARPVSASRRSDGQQSISPTSESGDSNVRNATGACAGARSTFPGLYLRAETARGGPPDHRARVRCSVASPSRRVECLRR